MIEMIFNKELIITLKKIITKEEFELLYQRFVNGLSIRELSPKYKITPEGLVVRTNNILAKIKKHFKSKLIC